LLSLAEEFKRRLLRFLFKIIGKINEDRIFAELEKNIQDILAAPEYFRITLQVKAFKSALDVIQEQWESLWMP